MLSVRLVRDRSCYPEGQGVQLAYGPLSATMLLAGLLATACSAPVVRPPVAGETVSLRVSNNHEVPYQGPVQFAVDLPDGTYGGQSAAGEIRSGMARVAVSLAAESDVILNPVGVLRDGTFSAGPLAMSPSGDSISLSWEGMPLGSLELGLVVQPGDTGGPDDVPALFEPLSISWRRLPGGYLEGEAIRDGFAVTVTVARYGGGWIDVHSRVRRLKNTDEPAYVALVRRITTAGLENGRLRLNGRNLDGVNSPAVWERDFWYTHGVDWVSWQANGLSLLGVNGFTPLPPILRQGKWVEGSHFYVWEQTRRDGNRLYLISQLSGPNAEQAKSKYMPVTPYAPIYPGDTITLKWRLAVERAPPAGWEEGQLRVFSGYREATRADDRVHLQLGVPGVSFGTSYFPYSTFNENFDFVRVPGLDRETWWPFSPRVWSDWEAFVPRMQTDLHIIRAMGFEWVRLHHLELLQQMERSEAISFLDWFIDAARELDLQVMADTEGPPEWIELVAKRYPDVIRRLELENEILIPGISEGDAERWTSLYQAAKSAAPEVEVFLTSAGNHGMFERLRTLDVPFDRVGLHAYKHGPEWMEAFSSHALGTGGYASDIGKPATLGEFNWKGFTRLSPEDRRKEFIATFRNILEPRAIPELFQFHFQETLSVNPSISRSGIRHYETIALDRRPKPEAVELMRLIRQYARPDAPEREISVEMAEVTLVDHQAETRFTITNQSQRPLDLEIEAVAFGGIETRLEAPRRVELEPGESTAGDIELRLPANSLPGTYHHFLKITEGARTTYGWGIAANPGAPEFEPEPVLKEQVFYSNGVGAVDNIDWRRPLAVVFGSEATALELEMAYITANTLQAATGRPVHLSSTADLPDSLANQATLILVGTPHSNPLIQMLPDSLAADKGVVAVRDEGRAGQRVLLTGRTPERVQAGATDFVLRYWQNAKDAAIRVVGFEAGAAFGNKAGITEPDPP